MPVSLLESCAALVSRHQHKVAEYVTLRRNNFQEICQERQCSDPFLCIKVPVCRVDIRAALTLVSHLVLPHPFCKCCESLSLNVLHKCSLWPQQKTDYGETVYHIGMETIIISVLLNVFVMTKWYLTQS